jgi:hypothetical protein
MLKSRVIFSRLLFAASTVTVPTGPAVAQYGHWRYRSPFQFGRRYAQFRQEAPWRRWESAQRASHQSMKPSHREGFEAPHQQARSALTTRAVLPLCAS